MEWHPNIENYLNTMKMVCPELEDHHLTEFASCLEIRSFEKHDILLPEGMIQEHVVL